MFLLREDATLGCENVIKNQHKCVNTIWIFSQPTSKAAVELIKLGQIGEGARTKSDRLSLTENCSLLIKNLSAEDAGLYGCQQYDSRGQKLGSDAQVYLSVVTSEYSLPDVFISTSESLSFIFTETNKSNCTRVSQQPICTCCPWARKQNKNKHREKQESYTILNDIIHKRKHKMDLTSNCTIHKSQ